ncbi:N-acetylmuramoyl-L-alanine amidase [Roseivirga sp. E12]|uniref:N-acetylmuramoyl-L-alanine amidase family protein n=1 Tax=Roseivirga sp. E12 TaxID=2819237 RepID=UPI001F358D3C|nr:N-acetylmuramoyl-L-alanine amidase [Roseivirga sp. E12]
MRKVILIDRFIRIKVKNYSLLVIFLIISCLQVNAMQNPNGGSKKKYKVVLDAGHGGKDPGTRGKNLKEKDVVLPVTLLVGKYLETLTDNIEVIYTRKNDEYSHPKVRAIMANDAEADLFVSIHANAMNPGYESVSGTEVFVMGTKNEGRNFEVAKRENSVILLEDNYEEIYQGFDPNAPEVDIMFSIQQEAYQENSIILASNIDEQFKKRAGRKSRGVKQSSLWVLWSTYMPSVLVELGYLTNPKEEKDLGNPEVQDYLASAVFRAIRDYFEYLESTGN